MSNFNYIDAMRDVMGRLNPRREEIVYGILETLTELGLDKMESMISVGPAGGDVDVSVLKAFPRCLHYWGIEPDENNCRVLKENMESHHPSMEVIVAQTKAEEWTGPKEYVDIALLSYVMYFITNRKQFLERVTSWIKPGGIVIIVNENDRSEWRRFVMDTVHGANSIPVYHRSHLMEEIRSLSNIQIEQEIHKDHVMDVRMPSKGLSNMLMMRESTDIEMETIFRALRSFEPSGILPCGSTLTVLKKLR